MKLFMLLEPYLLVSLIPQCIYEVQLVDDSRIEICADVLKAV